METPGLALRLLGGAFLLLMNGFFVASEFAMTRVPQLDDEELANNRGHERAQQMTENLEVYLTGCQFGITIASISLGFVAEPAVSALVQTGLDAAGYAVPGGGHTLLAIALSLAVINGLHVVIGEQTPTYLGVERTKTVAKYLVPGLYWWTKGLGPFISLADWLAKGLLGLFGVTISGSWEETETEGDEEEEKDRSFADIRTEMNRTLAQVGLSEERREEVLNALEISNQPISDVLVPRDEMVTLTAGEVEENLQRIRDHPQYDRFPLFDGGSTTASSNGTGLAGIVHATVVLSNIDDIRDRNETFADVAAPPMTMTAETAVSDAIDEFQAENQEMAVVVEDERVVGLLTAEDAFEAIAGDLEDPFDTSDEN